MVFDFSSATSQVDLLESISLANAGALSRARRVGLTE